MPNVSHYACLLRVIRDESGAWRANRLLEVDAEIMKRRSIWKVGELTPDGQVAQLWVGETTHKTTYAWERWDLVNSSMIERIETAQ
jgi:hypothetical protein